MQKTSIFIVLIFTAAIFTSCVSQNKYKAAVAENNSLNEQNAGLQNQIVDINKKLSDSKGQHQAVTTEYSDYKTNCEEMEKRMKAYQASVMEDYQTLMELEKIVNDAVANFEGHGMEVSEKDGRIYIDMADNLLFKSGSSTLGEDGKKALSALAGALNNYPNLKVLVVGHTDSVKSRNSANDNLRLSTDRANSVVRELVGNFGVSPVRMISAGQGKYAPLADNSTSEGRAKNRRTDIILLPDFEKLWEYLKSSPQGATSSN